MDGSELVGRHGSEKVGGHLAHRGGSLRREWLGYHEEHGWCKSAEVE